MNWLRTVLGALVAMLIVIGIAVPLSTHLAPLAGRQVFAVRGASMAPAIPMGSLIVVADHGTDELGTGDVITWRGDNGVWVTHRIVQVVHENGERMFQTQGDANQKPDGFVVPARAVIGSVEFSIPLVGFVMIMLATPAGVISWLSFALGLLVADALLGGGGNGQTWPRLDWPSRRRATLSRDAAERSATSAAVLARLHRTLRGPTNAESPAATGWPIHFEGVTVFGDDPLLLDEMMRCADGDHSQCITDVRPRACLIQTETASTRAVAADAGPEPGAARALPVALPSVREAATRDEAVAWVSREVSRAAA